MICTYDFAYIDSPPSLKHFSSSSSETDAIHSCNSREPSYQWGWAWYALYFESPWTFIVI